MLRILEIAWLIFAILGASFGFYKLTTEGVSESLFVFFFTLIAFVFYLVRRKQRIAMDKENGNTNSSSGS